MSTPNFWAELSAHRNIERLSVTFLQLGECVHSPTVCSGSLLGCAHSFSRKAPIVFVGNARLIQQGRVLFPYVMLGDVNSRIAVGFGNRVLVTDSGHELLTRHPRDLICLGGAGSSG
jgi:hypothetical protein